ncbi:Z1 domain-containing protein [Mesoplasma florum]|uniref:Z1 domain-containing protein n=1 Tax=Mesoplasma florum TaxID=2151 RepID=UPI000D087975|nr:Z1 domain-containing protein [Mesoplasma florum]AVN60988.1 hypothetical protein CG005_01625 [Mesoplasma florum]
MENIYKENFIKKYINKIGDESVNNILDSAERILNMVNNSNNRKGLLIGKVQSGKTSNFLGIMSLALSQGYKYIFLIGGKDDQLRNQNTDRIKELFGNLKSEKGLKTKLVNIYNSSSLNEENELNEIRTKMNSNKPFIFSVLKETKNLENFSNFIKDEIPADEKILVIDDEGDQGSLDNNKTKKNNSEKTRWNNIISQTLKSRSNILFLTVTGTPYANMLIPSDEDLSPDFFQSTKTGKGYMGLDFFHNSEDENNVLEIISETEKDVFKIDSENTLGDIYNTKLAEAISYYINASIKLINDDSENFQKTEMLVHAERKKNDHKHILNLINKLKKDVLNESYEDFNSYSYTYFLDFINKGYKKIYGTEYLWESDKGYYTEIFKEALQELSIIAINSSDYGKNLEEIKNNNSCLSIIVGADLLERGITIENLLTVYFSRFAKSTNNADTTLQRARWFGYREKIKHLIKVYLTEEIADAFFALKCLEDNLWEWIEEVELKENVNFKEELNDLKLNLSFNNDKKHKTTLIPTRKTVAFVQKDNISRNLSQKKYTDREISSFEYSYIDKINDEGSLEIYGTENKMTLSYKDWEDFKKENIYIYLLRNLDISEKDLQRFENFQNLSVKIVLMNNFKDKNYRTVYSDGKIQLEGTGSDISLEKIKANKNLFKTKYLGDRNVKFYPSNNGKIIIQIYCFNFKLNKFLNSEEELNKKGIGYSIYVPSEASTVFFRQNTN